MEPSTPWSLPPTPPPVTRQDGGPDGTSVPGPDTAPRGSEPRSRVTKAIAVGALGLGLAVGGFTVANAASSPSATPTTPAPSAGTTAAQSNEDPTHEAGESAQREADEAAGRVGGEGLGRHGSNEDPAHEATESPTREAQEGTNASGSSTTPHDDLPPSTTPSTTAAPGV
jgi:hypothetical protein